MIPIETCANYTDKTMYFSSDERKLINRVHSLKEKYPDEVEILKEPQDNDGCIYARMPSCWLRINPPRKVTTSEERREMLSERLREMRKKREQSKLKES